MRFAITTLKVFSVMNVKKNLARFALMHMVANSKMGFFKIITLDGVVDIEDMTAEELLGVQVELMKEDN